MRQWTLVFTDSSSQLGCRNSSSKPASPASRNYLLGYPGYREELEALRYRRELGYPGYRYRGELGYPRYRKELEAPRYRGELEHPARHRTPRATYKMILRQDTLLLTHSSSHTYCRSSCGIDPEYGDTTQIVRTPGAAPIVKKQLGIQWKHLS